MKPSLTFCLLAFALQSFSCADAVVENSVSAVNSSTEQSAENRSAGNKSTRPDQQKPSASPANEVLAVGKDYIKKSGWTVPVSNDANIIKIDADMGTTKDGNEVKVSTIHYNHKTPKSYSENLDPEYLIWESMKGNLISGGFTEHRVNGKAFMYSIFAEKVARPPASNSDPHLEPFVYQIMDTDGDGIFETLLGDYDKIIVPDWVLK